MARDDKAASDKESHKNAANSTPTVSGMTPPIAKKIHTENHINGGNLVDDYRWLRDKHNSEVAAYLNAENAYTDAVMKPTDELQKKLFDEMVGHIKETDEEVPHRYRGWLYYSRWEKGKQYRIFARKRTLQAPEEITLDQNQLAEGEKFLSLGAYSVSDDGNFLPYSTDNTGSGSSGCTCAICAPGKTYPIRRSAWVRFPGRMTIRRCFTRLKTRKPSGSTVCTVTESGKAEAAALTNSSTRKKMSASTLV